MGSGVRQPRGGGPVAEEMMSSSERVRSRWAEPDTPGTHTWLTLPMGPPEGQVGSSLCTSCPGVRDPGVGSAGKVASCLKGGAGRGLGSNLAHSQTTASK